MKSIIPLLLFFVGSVLSKIFVQDCSYFNNCPKGWDKQYLGSTGKFLECRCIRDGDPEPPCEKEKYRCTAYLFPECRFVNTACKPESVLELCTPGVVYPEFYHPEVCDEAAEKIRLEEEAKDTEKKPKLCSELKKRCLDGEKYACGVLPKHCDIDTINGLCESGKVIDLEACISAKKGKRKIEEEKTKYTCNLAIDSCKSREIGILSCDEIPKFCGSESIAKACYKNIFKDTAVCDAAIKRSQYLTIEEIDEDKCMMAIEQCNAGKFDACAEIPAVCGAPVVAGMCKKNYTIKNTLNLKLMCKGVDVTESNPGCFDLSYGCESHGYGCKLTQQFCDLKTLSGLCNSNILDRDSEKCKQALAKYPPRGR